MRYDGKQVYLPKFYSVATFWLIYCMNPCSAFKGFTSVFGGASIKTMDTMKPEKCTDVDLHNTVKKLVVVVEG